MQDGRSQTRGPRQGQVEGMAVEFGKGEANVSCSNVGKGVLHKSQEDGHRGGVGGRGDKEDMKQEQGQRGVYCSGSEQGVGPGQQQQMGMLAPLRYGSGGTSVSGGGGGAHMMNNVGNGMWLGQQASPNYK